MGSFWGELFQFGSYKRSQGRVARQVTLAVLAIVTALAAWRLYTVWTGFPNGIQDLFGESGRYIIPTILLVVGLWLSFRAVNYPKFADFLIAVEAEMNKVSWPSRGELVRASLVVIFVILLLAGLLYFYDIFWMFIFGENVLGVLKTGSGG